MARAKLGEGIWWPLVKPLAYVSDVFKRREIGMATKDRTLEATVHGKGCLGKAASTEEVFVLRAKDTFAPLAIIDWSRRVLNTLHATEHTAGMLRVALPEHTMTRRKVADALRIAAAMLEQQAEHGAKVPD